MSESFEPKYRQRSSYRVPVTSRWSLPVKLFLGFYVAVFAYQYVAHIGNFAVVLDGYLSLSWVDLSSGPWRPLTFLLVHAPQDPFHFAMVILSLVVLAPDLEEKLGRRFLLGLFLVSGWGAGAAHLVATAALDGVIDPYARTLGASGAVYGLLPVYFWYFREDEAFGLLRGKVLVPILFLFLFVSGMKSNDTSIGSAIEYRTQVAGVLFGVGFLVVVPRFRRLRKRREVEREIKDMVDDAEVTVRVDQLLEKIFHEGMGALSRKEKRYLRKASRQFRRLPRDDPPGAPPEDG